VLDLHKVSPADGGVFQVLPSAGNVRIVNQNLNKKESFMKDNLFDKEFTVLDVVKILLLVVTAFSTWNVIDLMTPNTSLSFVREFAALGVVEGAFLGFEMATARAKSRRQTKFATIGFFCSLVVIGVFAGVSGLLEFGGPELLAQNMGQWLGITWFVKDVVMVSSLVTLVVWIVVLAALYRMYSLNDPDKRAELDRIELDEEVTEESNKATRIALQRAQPTIASARARAHVKDKYTGEVGLGEMEKLLERVDTRLQENYGQSAVSSQQVVVDPARGFVPRVPPMQKTIRPVVKDEDDDKSTDPAEFWSRSLHLPEVFRGEPIYFELAVKEYGIDAGTPVQAILCEDGKYNFGILNATYCTARVNAEEFEYLRTGVQVEEKPSGKSFRSQ
jgi:hypothetical protein